MGEEEERSLMILPSNFSLVYLSLILLDVSHPESESHRVVIELSNNISKSTCNLSWKKRVWSLLESLFIIS